MRRQYKDKLTPYDLQAAGVSPEPVVCRVRGTDGQRKERGRSKMLTTVLILTALNTLLQLVTVYPPRLRG